MLFIMFPPCQTNEFRDKTCVIPHTRNRPCKRRERRGKRTRSNMKPPPPLTRNDRVKEREGREGERDMPASASPDAFGSGSGVAKKTTGALVVSFHPPSPKALVAPAKRRQETRGQRGISAKASQGTNRLEFPPTIESCRRSTRGGRTMMTSGESRWMMEGSNEDGACVGERAGAGRRSATANVLGDGDDVEG